MADFKGFGSKPPELSPITLAEVNEAEMDGSRHAVLPSPRLQQGYGSRRS